jgi:hypothetical protein
MQLLTYTGHSLPPSRSSIDPTAADAEIACVANMWVYYKILASLGFSIFQDAVRRQAKAWCLEDIQATNRVYATDIPRFHFVWHTRLRNGPPTLLIQSA